MLMARWLPIGATTFLCNNMGYFGVYFFSSCYSLMADVSVGEHAGLS